MKPKFQYKEEKREKNTFYASDVDKLGIDLIFGFKKEPETNPIEWNDTLRMGAGKGAELAMIEVLKQNEIIEQDFDQDDVPTTEIEREGVKIRMKFDATVKKGGVEIEMNDLIFPQGKKVKLEEGEPIEIKTINNKNSFDIAKYNDNKPRESYVKQLAMYMDALGKTQGHLFVCAIDGLNWFWFICEKQEDGTYKAGDVVVDINKEYKRWATIWADKDKDYTDLKQYIFEEKYKIPVSEIDFSKLSVTAISDMRNGRKVVGTENSWKIQYSSYKNKILELQGEKPGYSEAEIEEIKTKTAGFTSKTKKNESNS